MTPREKVNILLVDDQPAKLLSVEVVLAELGENIIKAESADEALKHLLAHDIAVVLVDVCMPRMDGFELAELIRDHPRFRRTAIIFISAVHLTDADRLKGYRLGAVDYMPVPLIPDVLRAKVAVFADLYRKTHQLERLNRELEARVAERTADLEASAGRLRESEQRYRELVQGLPTALYTCDVEGRITLYNDAAVALWGRRPDLAADRWCGAFRLYRPDGAPLRPEETAIAVTLRDGRPARGEEVVIERPDGVRRNVVSYPELIRDASQQVVGVVNMLTDVTDARAADRARVLLAAIVASSDDAIISKTLDGTITSWNAGAERMFGYTAAQTIGQSISLIIPADAMEEQRQIMERIRRGEHIQHFETVRLTKDARRVPISLTISPLRNAAGLVIGASKVARDITERRNAEQVLKRDRETLERLVADRTAELERSNERLRLADRMATIGTLSAGLGHDMGNLLLPIRMRLDAIESSDLDPSVREDIVAIRKATEYLQRLAGSLRLLAINPDSEDVEDASTDLGEWWQEAEGMIRNGVPRSVTLTAEIPAGLPRVRIGRAALTQITFNLVQNAGDALKGRADGRIRVSALLSPDAPAVRLCVADNGPGMTDEAKRRCLEPFFTTKTRGLSTGLGLALVSGLLKRAHGSLQIESTPGTGAEFKLDFPPARTAIETAGAHPRERHVAVVTLKDARLVAHVQSVLASLEFDVRQGDEPADADLWVTEADTEDAFAAAHRFVASLPVRRAVVFGAPVDRGNGHDRVVCLETAIKPSALRTRIRGVLSAFDTTGARG